MVQTCYSSRSCVYFSAANAVEKQMYKSVCKSFLRASKDIAKILFILALVILIYLTWPANNTFFHQGIIFVS